MWAGELLLKQYRKWQQKRPARPNDQNVAPIVRSVNVGDTVVIIDGVDAGKGGVITEIDGADPLVEIPQDKYSVTLQNNAAAPPEAAQGEAAQGEAAQVEAAEAEAAQVATVVVCQRHQLQVQAQAPVAPPPQPPANEPDTATVVTKFLRQPRLKLHAMVVREMIQLEKGLVVALNTAVQAYAVPLREATEAGFLALDPHHYSVVFGRFEPLFDSHYELLVALTMAVRDRWPDAEIGDALEAWAANGLQLHEEWQSSMAHMTQVLSEIRAEDPVLRNLMVHGVGKIMESQPQNNTPQGGLWDAEASWRGIEQLLKLKPTHSALLSCQLGETPSCAGLTSFEELMEAPSAYLHKMHGLVMQWYLTMDETKSPAQLQQASNTLSAVAVAATFVEKARTRCADEAISSSILQWIDLPHSVPSVGLKFMREGPVDCMWADGPLLPSYAYLFDIVLVIVSHQRTGVKYQYHLMLSGVNVQPVETNSSSLTLHKPAVAAEPAARMTLHTPTAADAQSWAAALTELSRTIDAQQVIDEWEQLEATLEGGRSAAEEHEIIQAEHIKRAQLKQLIADKLEALQQQFCEIETLSNAAESRFWKSVMWSYFHAVRTKGQFSVVGLEGISHEEQLVEAAMAAVRHRVSQLEDAFVQADHTFVGQLQERLSKHLERHDVAQMQVCAVLESLNAKFEMLGRKVLTCDKLVRDRDARGEGALEHLRQEKATLHRKRLEKKREFNMHKETMDIAKRENSELREELVAVQRQIEQAHRKLIDDEVKRRKNARRDGGAQNP